MNYNFGTYQLYRNGVHITEGAEEGDVMSMSYSHPFIIKSGDSNGESEAKDIPEIIGSSYTSKGVNSTTMLNQIEKRNYNPEGLIIAFNSQPIIGYDIPQDISSIYIGRAGYGDSFNINPGDLIIFNTGDKFDIKLPWDTNESKSLNHLKRFKNF